MLIHGSTDFYYIVHVTNKKFMYDCKSIPVHHCCLCKKPLFYEN